MPFPAVFELSSLNGTNGFAINGINMGDFSGYSVSSAGDVNNDGFDDLLIGAPFASTNIYYSGQSYVVFGGGNGFSASLDLSTLNGTNGFAINGINADDHSGYSVSSAGDINGDGFDDLLIGAPGRILSSTPGQSYVVFGGGGFSASFNLSTLNGTNGFVINGINAADRSGLSVSSAGDVNGDGFDDLLIGAKYADPNGSASGQSYVVFGGSGFSASLDLSTLNGTNGFAINGINIDYSYSGSSVSKAGDVNGDGFDDLIIGAPGTLFTSAPSSTPGQSYVVFGRSGGFSASLNLSTLDGTNGFVINGINAADRSGWSVSNAGDVNGDGFDDLLIGARGADPNGGYSGQSYVVFGRSGDFSTSLDLSTLNGTNGFAINGINADDRSGYSVSSVGDVNNDGFDDLIIGALYADPNGISSAGQSYVVFGRSGDFSTSLDLSTLNGTNGFAINGINMGDFSGRSVSSAGDVNNDGFDDLIIGAPYASLNGISSAGQSYVIFGQDDLANFDPAQYGASNPDLIPVFGYNLEAFRQHYLDFGRFEGRSIDNFDEFRYIASNPQLIPFFGTDGAAATEHYLRYGFDEGRFLTSFDPAQYLASNGDLINVYNYNLSEATLHYIQYGFNDDRPTDTFAETTYIVSYDDLTRYYGYNPTGGTEHYILYGYDEIQAGTRPQPSFDPALYLATYTDLIQSVNQQFAEPNTGAFVDNYGSVLEFGNFHFITYGINENRSRLGFDPNSYLNLNPDLQAAFGNDLLAATRHYIEFGFEEERITL